MCATGSIACCEAGAAYFGYGTRLPAYRAIDNHVYDRVRHFLVRRHKVPSRGTGRFPAEAVFGALGVLRLRHVHLGAPRVPRVKPVGKPDAGKPHVRFDERGRETERCRHGRRHRALPRLYQRLGAAGGWASRSGYGRAVGGWGSRSVVEPNFGRATAARDAGRGRYGRGGQKAAARFR